jgi:esterase/lipase superfamily enzyme
MSFKALRTVVIGLGLGLALSACASGGTKDLSIGVVQPGDALGNVRIFVATTRERGTEASLFTGERGPKNAFATIDISVPRAHVAGELELPSSGAPTPSRHFTVTQARRLELPQITSEVRAAIAKRPANERDVLVFVHGFNTTFADASFRLAQIVHDAGFKGVPVLFTWPSRGELLAYPYDRESALYSRDFLEASLRALGKDLGAGRIDILAHSMGNMLTLETLRQAKIRGDGSFSGKLRDVMLASPDVDLDVFRTQARIIDRPMTVFVSKDDKALDFSRRFAGDKRRLGALSEDDVDMIAKLKSEKIEVIDMSSIKTSDSLNHGKFAASPKIVGLIGRRLASDGGIGINSPGLGHAISTSLETIVNAPVQILTGGQGPSLSLPR